MIGNKAMDVTYRRINKTMSFYDSSILGEGLGVVKDISNNKPWIG